MTGGQASPADRPAEDSPPRDRNEGSDPAALTSGTLPPLDPNAKSPDALWDDYFSKRNPSAETVRDTVSRLHDARRHDHVAAAIRAALRHGQGQPWMYEVLALTLEIQGAPKAEVERALLSQIDFAATDAQGLMVSAAYLTRFEADRPALRLYRQASELAPERPEPYLLGLKLARRLADDDALAWAARGVLTSAWGEDHARQHRDAENAVADRVKELRDMGKVAEADALTAAVGEAKRVDLHVRLDWGGEGDLDLAIHEPSGSVCSFENPRTAGGGVLTHDGHGPNQENCFDEYVCAAGFAGVYRIKVRHAWGDVVGKRAKLTITRGRGTPHESTREVSVPITEEGSVVRVTLSEGRRAELLAVPEEPEPRAGIRPPIGRLIGRLDPEAERAAKRFRDSLFRQVGGNVGGVTPAVGIGAVGYAPQITLLTEGVTLNTLAVVSGDRRYVRLSINPSFTALVGVENFTFLSTGP